MPIQKQIKCICKCEWYTAYVMNVYQWDIVVDDTISASLVDKELFHVNYGKIMSADAMAADVTLADIILILYNWKIIFLHGCKFISFSCAVSVK